MLSLSVRDFLAQRDSHWQVANVYSSNMRDHYEFSKGTRGKFFRPDAIFRSPVYLDKTVQSTLAAMAEAKGVDLSQLVNDLLRKDIELIEAAPAIR